MSNAVTLGEVKNLIFLKKLIASKMPDETFYTNQIGFSSSKIQKLTLVWMDNLDKLVQPPTKRLYLRIEKKKINQSKLKLNKGTAFSGNARSFLDLYT